MKLHANAKTTPRSKAIIVQRAQHGWTRAEVAEAAGVSVRTVDKWVRHFREGGSPGLLDRSSAPHSCPNDTPSRVVTPHSGIASEAADSRTHRPTARHGVVHRLRRSQTNRHDGTEKGDKSLCPRCGDVAFRLVIHMPPRDCPESGALGGESGPEHDKT